MSRPGRAIGAGLLGALAYLAAQEIDRRIVNPRSNDLVLLGGLFASRQPARGLIGIALHLLGGVSLGLLFETFAASRLPGPYWLRGIVLVQIENTTLWPLCHPLERVHPAIRSGELASLTSPVYFGQQVWRHLALGLVLGLLLGPKPAAPAESLPEHPTRTSASA